MEEELKTKLMEWLDKIEGAAEVGGDFVIEQAPLVIQEYLAWYFWSSVFLAVAQCLLIAFLAGSSFAFVRVCFRKADKIDKESGQSSYLSGSSEWRFGSVTAGAISAVVCALLTMGAMASAYDAIKVTVAPRVVLLEKAAELAK